MGSCDGSNSSQSVSKSISASASKSGTKHDKPSDAPLSQCSHSPATKPLKTPRTLEKRKVVPDIVITEVKLATGKRCVPAVTFSPTKLKLKERKWKAHNPSPSSSSSFSLSHAESSLRPRKLKVMPRMKKNRRPSDVIKWIATTHLFCVYSKQHLTKPSLNLYQCSIQLSSSISPTPEPRIRRHVLDITHKFMLPTDSPLLLRSQCSPTSMKTWSR
ncbi:hypothetical protein F5887DRAFT_39988 [Amanita rubescens]|nr:hypothetical protein F5887DRAFT_39988 [Amanita rubescens]